MKYALALALWLVTVGYHGIAEAQDASTGSAALEAENLLKSTYDVGIIEESEKLVTQTGLLLDTIREKPDDAAGYLEEIRPLRAKVSKRSPMLRALVETLKQFKASLAIQQSSSYAMLTSEAPSNASLGSDVKFRQFDIENRLRNARVAQQQSNGTVVDDIDKLEEELSKINDEVKKAEDEQKRVESERKLATEKRDSEIKAQIEVADKYIQRSNTVSRNLDETLSLLDDASGSLLQSNLKESAYTDRSTIIFAILVGGVIIGFFAIAFISPAVRDAIFTGESGIQFVTLFSLVIAIILFGVLKILEGKELAALLGGLSGYILGRAGQPLAATPYRQPEGDTRTPTEPQKETDKAQLQKADAANQAVHPMPGPFNRTT
ncbi:hypothetical protein [Rhizobium leguminosarum]|uniref:hypothetical protein n=1 Tax=Rhizobium leguminosarum TaxID=384 RepID=UPI003F9DFAA6